MEKGKPISLKQLFDIFVGRKVIVESKSADGKNPHVNGKKVGICKALRTIGSTIDIVLGDGTCLNLVPETITDSSVEGKAGGFVKLNRKIKLL